METKEYYIYKVSTHCAWMGDHQSATETYITNSPDTDFVSMDKDISVEATSATLIDPADVAALLKHIPHLTDLENDVCEVSGLDLNEEHVFW